MISKGSKKGHSSLCTLYLDLGFLSIVYTSYNRVREKLFMMKYKKLFDDNAAESAITLLFGTMSLMFTD